MAGAMGLEAEELRGTIKRRSTKEVTVVTAAAMASANQ